MFRIFTILFLGAACIARPAAPHDALDPAFAKIPFEQWLGERDQPRFHWTAGVPRAELSFHQRLIARLEVKLDGKDLESRRGEGKLVFLVQVTDQAGVRYQDHGSLELSRLDENIRSANLEYAQRCFILPGEYRLAVAIFNTNTGEHSTKQLQFRVAPEHDLLTRAWQDLPPVEFIGDEQPPDSWYLPYIHGQLQWAASKQSAARVNIILNVAPTAPVPGSRRPQGGEMAALLPTLKALSETGSPSISEHVALLDLGRRKAVFHQNEVHKLDWNRLKASLGEASTASIDVHSLADRHRDAQFFLSQVRSLLRASEKPCVLVVLTKPLAFDPGEDLEPLSLEGLPACRVVYIRYRTPLERENPYAREMEARRRGRGLGGPMNRNRALEDVPDQLASTLKAFSPKVIDVETPDQMTKAFAEIQKVLP